MNGRELVILLLGLAIVAVVLRGLFVAINARRGQIKLAIDKNIPHNVDLESLELAELPGGGARVVTRSLEEVNRQNNALDRAETKAKSLNLSDAEVDGHIPVLMDTVELSVPTAARVIPSRQYQQKVEGLEGFIPDTNQEHSVVEDWDEDEPESEIEDDYSQSQADQQHVAQNENDPDSALFDYDEEELEDDEQEDDEQEDEVRINVDTMSSVAPDYTEEPELEDEREGLTTASAEIIDDDSYAGHEESDFDEDLNEQAELSEQELTPEPDQEQPALFDADSSADEFSMQAGERIGGNPPSIGEANQSGLFDDIDENAVEVVNKSKSSRSLFSLFARKSKQSRGAVDSAQLATAATEMKTAVVDEPDDVLLEEEYVQVDIDDVEHEESVYAESATGEEIADELDQKRTATLAIEPEEQEAHPEEFEHSEVLVLNVAARDGRVFSGDDLLRVLITSGLKFGDMNIFHKRLSKEHQGTVVFSVANMLNPGTFDLNNMDDFTTLGISFFLALPTPINNLDAFEQMLDVAQEIRATLGGDLKDDHRNAMTGQTIEHYRQRIRDFELRRLKAVAARG
ncbi:MAG: cell division protein ZipA [Pseudomonadales bacterium]